MSSFFRGLLISIHWYSSWQWTCNIWSPLQISSYLIQNHSCFTFLQEFTDCTKFDSTFSLAYPGEQLKTGIPTVPGKMSRLQVLALASCLFFPLGVSTLNITVDSYARLALNYSQWSLDVMEVHQEGYGKIECGGLCSAKRDNGYEVFSKTISLTN